MPVRVLCVLSALFLTSWFVFSLAAELIMSALPFPIHSEKIEGRGG
jgi:hypothetical protein